MSSYENSSSMEKAQMRFAEAQADLKEFMGANPEVADTLLQLIENYNTTRDNLVTRMREVDTEKRFSVGEFTRGAKPSSIVYSPTDLDSSILAMPGVIKKNGIDSKVIAGLIERGEILAEKVSGARKEVLGTPRVTGPKEITWSL